MESIKTTRERGFFLDLKTLAAALTSTPHSLDSLAEFLEVPRKTSFQDFGREIRIDRSMVGGFTFTLSDRFLSVRPKRY
jgi:hypothetical protein